MANIRVDVDYTIADGAELLFYAPCDFANISGLKVYYPGADAGIVSHEFTFQDAHKNDLSNLDNLFAEGACVKVILSLTNSTAYIQNADTNAYLEGRFDDFVNGTTQVGNAKTLDGHEAEYFLSKSGGTIDGNILVSTSASATRAMGLKNTVREIEHLLYANDGFYALRDMTKGKNIIESKADGTNTFNGTASGNLPLSGGTLKNPSGIYVLHINSEYEADERTLIRFLKNGTNMGSFGFKGADTPIFYSTGGSAKEFLHTGNMASHVLPLSGGTVQNSSREMLKLKNTSGTAVGIGFYLQDTKIGELRASASGLSLADSASNGTLLHTGNKPTGTYTGNGDATTRRIAIGGIGDVVVLTSVNGSAIVTVGGTTVNSPSGGVSRLSTDEVKAVNGYLNLATTNSIVNGNGVEVTYRVL